MLIYLVDGEMLLCMPMEMIIVGPIHNAFYNYDNNMILASQIAYSLAKKEQGGQQGPAPSLNNFEMACGPLMAPN